MWHRHEFRITVNITRVGMLAFNGDRPRRRASFRLIKRHQIACRFDNARITESRRESGGFFIAWVFASNRRKSRRSDIARLRGDTSLHREPHRYHLPSPYFCLSSVIYISVVGMLRCVNGRDAELPRPHFRHRLSEMIIYKFRAICAGRNAMKLNFK